MALSWPTAKDPDEVLDYLVRWQNRLVPHADTIQSCNFSVVSGAVVVDSFSFDGGAHTTTVWLSGGTPGEMCEVLCEITTIQNRTWQQTVRLRIRDR